MNYYSDQGRRKNSMSERHPVSLRIGSHQFCDIPSLVRYYQSPEFERDYTYFGNDLGCTVKTN